MNAHEVLARTPLFAEVLDSEQIKFLSGQCRPAFFLAGTRLMNQGDFGGSMFVIVSGEVSVNLVDQDAREQSVAMLGPGDIVGEMSLFTGDRRSATVSAVSNVDAVEITKWSLERVFAKAPGLVDRFADVLARRQAQLNTIATTSASSRERFVRQARQAFSGLFSKSL